MIDKKEVLELIWQGKRYSCEEDCQCHTECPKADEYVKKIEPALHIANDEGHIEQLKCECKDEWMEDVIYVQCSKCGEKY